MSHGAFLWVKIVLVMLLPRIVECNLTYWNLIQKCAKSHSQRCGWFHKAVITTAVLS